MATLAKVTNVRVFEESNGSLWIGAEINGQPANIPVEQNLLVVENGYLAISAGFEGVLPPLEIPADPEVGRPQPETLLGGIDHPGLFKLWQQVVRDDKRDTLKLGPVELPE